MESPDPKKNKIVDNVCPSCEAKDPIEVGLNERKPADKGKQYNPFSTRFPVFAPRGTKLNSSKKITIEAKKKIKKEDDDEGSGAKGKYISEEFEQCSDINELKMVEMLKKKKRVDNLIDGDEIFQTCDTLAIDG